MYFIHFYAAGLTRKHLYAALFVSGIVFNLGALEHANVETLIVARSCLPLATCFLDYWFLGRQVSFGSKSSTLLSFSCGILNFKAPSLRSMASLGILAAGCASYVATDKQFLVEVATTFSVLERA